MSTLRGSFPVQVETRCEAGHLYRHSPLDSSECPICTDPPKTRGPITEGHRAKLIGNPGRAGRPLQASERKEIQRLHELGRSVNQIRLATGRGTAKVREALKGAE